MKSMKNRAVLVAISLCLMLCSACSSYATVVSSTKVYKVESKTLSEYDYVKKLQSKTDRELTEMGYEESDIKAIRDIDFDEYVQELKSSTPDTLAEQGFSNSAISVIQNSENEAEILAVTMGNVTYSVTAVSLTYSGGISRLKAMLQWSWSSKPTLTMKDIVAITTNKDFYRDSESEYNSTKIKYYKNGNKNTTAKTRTETQSTKSSGKVTFSRVPMKVAYASSTSDKDDVYYAMTGIMKVEMKESGKITTANVSGSYGHTIISCTPSVSIGLDGVGSITFTPELKVETGPESTHSIDL